MVKKKSKKTSKSSVTKEEDWDWRKELGIDVNEGDETTKSSKKVERKLPKKQKVTKEEDWDWRKELGIDVNEGDETTSKTSQTQYKTQQKTDGDGYGFIIVIVLIIIGAITYFNYSDNSSSNKGNTTSNSCYTALDGTYSQKGNSYTVNYKNSSGDGITITNVGIYIKNGKKIIKEISASVYIKPYGIGSTKINFYDLNKDLIGKPFFRCETGKSKKVQKKEDAWDNILNKKKGGFKWWYLLIGYVAFMVIRAVIAETSSKDKTSNTKQEETSEVKSSTSSTDDNFIEDVFEGKKPLGETFWLYYVVANGIISFGAGYLADVNDNNIFLIAALISNVWAGIGTWNSSTKYQLEKIKSGQPYGWAYGAKIMIVLNFLSIAAQAILLFSL